MGTLSRFKCFQNRQCSGNYCVQCYQHTGQETYVSTVEQYQTNILPRCKIFHLFKKIFSKLSSAKLPSSCNNSWESGILGCNLKLIISELISRRHILSISCEIAVRWMPEDLALWERNPLVTDGFPSQRVTSIAESVSMSLHHHVYHSVICHSNVIVNFTLSYIRTIFHFPFSYGSPLTSLHCQMKSWQWQLNGMTRIRQSTPSPPE